MARLVEEGKVRWAGVSNFGAGLLDRCEAVRHVDCVQPELSLLRPGAARDVIPWCRAHGTGVIVYSPLASGILAGARGPATVEAARGVSADQVLQVTRDLREYADRLRVSPGALAIAWTLATSGVTGAICGARRPDHVRGWIAAADLVLDQALASGLRTAGLRRSLRAP
jgi:aryl-alcohol dehydrogenase-like predicted oxidoreductase